MPHHSCRKRKYFLGLLKSPSTSWVFSKAQTEMEASMVGGKYIFHFSHPSMVGGFTFSPFFV
jgi:hypothetical protein